MTTANTATEEVQGNETPRTTFDTAWDAVLNESGKSDGSQSEEADQLYRKQLNDYLKEKRVLAGKTCTVSLACKHGEKVPQSTARQCICVETIFKCKTCPWSN